MQLIPRGRYDPGMGIPKKHLVADFLAAIRAEWMAAVSGGFGFIAAGFYAWFFPSETAFKVWSGISLIAVIWVCWRIWVVEHCKVLALEERLRPKFRVSFDQQRGGMVLAKHGHSAGPDAYYFRICVEATDEAATIECRAYITALEKRTGAEHAFVHVQLPQAICLTNEPRKVGYGVSEQIDFIIANSSDNALHPAPTISWPLVLAEVFSEQSVYRFTFKVNGDGITAQAICVEVVWKGQWDRVGATQVGAP